MARRTYGSYNDGCASAHALDLIGERWTLIVVRELLLGPKRFTDLQSDVMGIGPSVLTRRLHDLEEAGIARRRTLPGPGRAEVYELTEWGHSLEAVNTALSLWAVESPTLPVEADMSPDTIVLAMRAHARPVSRSNRARSIAVHLTDSRREGAEPVTYLAGIGRGATTIERAPEAGPVDAEVSSTTRAWKSCIIGGVPFEDLPEAEVTGDRRAVDDLVAATSLRQPE